MNSAPALSNLSNLLNLSEPVRTHPNLSNLLYVHPAH